MIFNTTSAEILDHDLDRSTHIALIRQIFYGFFGLLCGYGACKFGVRNLLGLSPLFFYFFCFLLALCLVPGIGIAANGARRWVGFGGISIQPSEFIKYITLIYFIFRLGRVEKESLNFSEFLKILLPLSFPLVLILLEPNNGTVGVIVSALVVVLFLAKVPFRFWGIPILVSLACCVVFAINMPYVARRLEVYLHPEIDLKGKGHQPHQAKIASGSGGVLGKGPGKSLQKLSYLPEAQNDYIAAIYAEEFGFLGILALITAYAWLAILGFTVAFRAKDLGSLYVGGSFTFLLSFQAFLNLGVVSGLIPSTGLNLPFFSQGGSSLIANFAALGVLVAISRESHVKETKNVWSMGSSFS